MSSRPPQCAVRAFALALLLAAGGPTLFGEDEPSHTSAAEDAVRRHDEQTELRVATLARIRISHPQRLSGAIGAIWARQPTSFDCTTTCEYRGFTLHAEPGLNGAQISAGYAKLIGEQQGHSRFVRDILLGFGIRGTLLRTWGDADLDPSSQTLVGAEADLSIVRVNFSLGLLRRVSGPDDADRWHLAGGIGWGF